MLSVRLDESSGEAEVRLAPSQIYKGTRAKAGLRERESGTRDAWDSPVVVGTVRAGAAHAVPKRKTR